MTTTIRIPTQLRQLTDGVGEVTVEAATVGDALRGLDASFPGFGERLFDEDVRFLSGLETALVAGQTISIVPAVAGGCA